MLRKDTAGARDPESGNFNTREYLLSGRMYLPTIDNTTIGVVATNARLTKEQAHKLASISHNGLALAIRPVHTMVDGDTMFALSTGEKDGDMLTIGCAAVKVTAQAIANAILFSS